MKRTLNQAQFVFLLCIATLAGCTHSSEEASQTSPMSGIALADMVCAQCHGLTGESVSPMFPKLAGQQKEYLKLQLADFKDHGRNNIAATQYMGGFTLLTKTQIDELANYFSRQSPMKAEADSPDVRGKLIFNQGLPGAGVAQCSSCHGTHGQGNGPVPRLAGQHAAYQIAQIKVFQQAAQRSRGDQTQQTAHALADEDAASVAHYMASQGAKN